MNDFLYSICFSAFLLSCTNLSNSNGSIVNDSEVGNNSFDIPAYVDALISAYPQFSLVYRNNYIIFPDGDSIQYDDMREKSFVETLDECDIEDMFFFEYDTTDVHPKYLHDCGRGRNEQLFKKMYGRNQAEVRSHLVRVDWFGQKILFTEVNNAAAQLEKVAKELIQYPQYCKFLTNASTFYWRKIRGANRLSAHSYGIAIDINTKYANYWLWSNPNCSEVARIQYENRIPIEIVRIFEKHGFIWGGRWYHYDTMHFEYRPELL